MRVLMLGWEYPPHITGGLGTACEGLTQALAKLGVQVHFVVPHLTGDERAPHMNLIDATLMPRLVADRHSAELSSPEGILPLRIPAFLAPYWSEDTFQRYIEGLSTLAAEQLAAAASALPQALRSLVGEVGQSRRTERYGTNIFLEVARFAANVLALAEGLSFDLIHAHDWMTYPAAVALARRSGKPLVVHVHSLEFDRSGEGGNERIKEIEKLGLDAADAVVAVSYYTAAVVQKQHQTPREKIYVVHNGVYPKEVVSSYQRGQFEGHKIVLFLGRITFQKGPDYFVEAAARVIPHIPKVLFVMAGAGDMLPQVVDRVHHLGIEKHFHFPGFLRGEEVEQVFSIADLYVMPSVSEPFGISALEAISFNTPVLISRQSGVSEVLGHALKVDFWDVHRMADLMINALLHRELRDDMVAMAREELRRLRWDAAASKAVEIYRRVAESRPACVNG